jgi:hypothetical protein
MYKFFITGKKLGFLFLFFSDRWATAILVRIYVSFCNIWKIVLKHRMKICTQIPVEAVLCPYWTVKDKILMFFGLPYDSEILQNKEINYQF